MLGLLFKWPSNANNFLAGGERLRGRMLASRILENYVVTVQTMKVYGEVDDIPTSSLPLH
jgi:hypothetical protein